MLVLFSTAKKGLDYLDLHWNVEFGDNEWYLVDADESQTARGFVKIASSNRDFISKSFSQLEGSLSSTQQERDAVAAKLAALETTLAAVCSHLSITRVVCLLNGICVYAY